MDWIPFFLTVSSAAFAAPLVLHFQREMAALDERRRECVRRLEQTEANLHRMVEEDARVREEIFIVTGVLEELEREKGDLEKKFQEVKKQYGEDPE